MLNLKSCCLKRTRSGKYKLLKKPDNKGTRARVGPHLGCLWSSPYIVYDQYTTSNDRSGRAHPEKRLYSVVCNHRWLGSCNTNSCFTLTQANPIIIPSCWNFITMKLNTYFHLSL